ncbi:MAG: lysophospholipid acyltransferase family protein [Sneathiella sp.]|nr:lysophospholipid acyltransferase family protein [Sneathiella sp.]
MPDTSMSGIRLKYKIEWLAVRFAFWFFRILGRKNASAFGKWLAQKIGPLLSAQKTASQNISLALPDIGEQERRQVLRKMWGNLGRNIGELPHTGQLDFDSPDIELVGADNLQSYISSGKSAFFLTAHYGPWELVISALSKYCKMPVSVIYRAANNPLVDEFFQAQRYSKDVHFIPKGKKGARGILKALKNKEAVALLNDQKQNTGIPIPFFGREAMTAPSIAELACKLNLPIYPVKAERLENGKMRVTVSEPIFGPSTGDRNKDVVQLLTTINEIYEDWIRERPDHWFWVHNRWPALTIDSQR